ncbi:hypothetical protein COX08_00250 [Candidatus Beckwithbacteria bacterium CG23_combo_of_CG06-09_8_20_14_all_34_8]|uniref:Big-1 domain-containing protein n=1 Tax=Candidatus Beckwithbacteria bacterium CG23_combo_of_CG06-09_8_20_14_all_34_8 TaxID=1974497 RepID=A0A2H0B7C2_9BACT|nr:MAG: hypothetical protein COX08_00250 [Candidatus Beckwithbacteria bacterium CG23_combo_of_CG06-09_8_20_14_all_34_8]
MIKKLFFIIIAVMLLVKPIWAADMTVICNTANKCSTLPSEGAALFSVDDIKPSYNFPKEFSVFNQDLDEDCYLYLKTENIQDPDQLNQTLYTVIKDPLTTYFGSLEDMNRAAIDQNLTDLFNQGTINLGKVDKGETKTYLWAVTMDPDAGNQYQGKTTQFDFDMTFECGIPPTPSPTPTATPGPTSSPDPNSGKHTTLGKNGPTCENLTFEITFDVKNDGNPVVDQEITFSYGGDTWTEYTNDDGRANTDAIYNGSGELKAETTDGYPSQSLYVDDLGDCGGGIGGGFTFGAFTATQGLVSGAFDQALQEATKAAGLVLPDGQIKGESDICCPKIEPLWWIVLLAQTLWLVRYFMQRIKNMDKSQWLLMTLAVTTLAIIIHWLGHPWFVSRGYTQSPYCRWLWLMAIINGLILSSVFRYVYKEEHE